MQEVWTGVLEIASQLDDVQYSLRALWGLWAFEQNVGRIPDALNLARRFCDLAMHSSNPADLATGDRLLGVTLHYLGDRAGAERYFERSLARLEFDRPWSDAIHFQYNQSLAARAYLPKNSVAAGFTRRRAAGCSKRCGRRCRHGPRFVALPRTGGGRCVLSPCSSVISRRRNASSTCCSAPPRPTPSTCGTSRAAVSAVRCSSAAGKPHEGRDLLLRAMKGPPYMESNVHRIEMLMELARAFACAATFNRASTSWTRHWPTARAGKSDGAVAELLRMKAEMLLGLDAPGSASCAEELLQQSLDWARSQQTLSWELRAASSLARLRLRQGDAREGRACLEPVYARFTEGFDTADLTAARQLLNGLNV